MLPSGLVRIAGCSRYFRGEILYVFDVVAGRQHQLAHAIKVKPPVRSPFQRAKIEVKSVNVNSAAHNKKEPHPSRCGPNPAHEGTGVIASILTTRHWFCNRSNVLFIHDFRPTTQAWFIYPKPFLFQAHPNWVISAQYH